MKFSKQIRSDQQRLVDQGVIVPLAAASLANGTGEGFAPVKAALMNAKCAEIRNKFQRQGGTAPVAVDPARRRVEARLRATNGI